jgi:hypothetical protein
VYYKLVLISTWLDHLNICIFDTCNGKEVSFFVAEDSIIKHVDLEEILLYFILVL